MKGGYTITYRASTVLGLRGFSYEIYYNGRLLAAGWSAGKQTDAENEVREYVRKREAA